MFHFMWSHRQIKKYSLICDPRPPLCQSLSELSTMHILSALLCLGLAFYFCHSANGVPVEYEVADGNVAENIDDESTTSVVVDNTSGTTLGEAENDPSSSEDSRSDETSEGTPIADESSEENDSSSEEEKREKTISKRSVESQKDTENNFEDNSNLDNRFPSKDDSSEPSNTEASESITTTAENSETTETTTEENEREDSPTTESQEASDTKENPTAKDTPQNTVFKLSDQIRKVLATYREKGVVQIPQQNFFQDPMTLQDFETGVGYGTMTFKNMSVSGLSNFSVEQVVTDIDKMQVFVLLKMQRLQILGNYTYKAFLSSAKAGPFNVTLLDVESEGVAFIQQAAEGFLEAADSALDMTTNQTLLKFENFGLSNLLESLGDTVFESIKPQVLDKVNEVIRSDINTKLRELSKNFIQKVSPVELAISEGRRYVKERGYDPFEVADRKFIVGGMVDVEISRFVVNGLSRFYRVGNFSLDLIDGCVQIGLHVATAELTGHCRWRGASFGIVAGGGTNFSVDHLQVRAMIKQSLDLSKKPQLENLDLELGMVKVTMQEKEPLNMLIEAFINAFPKLLRHMLVDSIEKPLKQRIQEILDEIPVQPFVEENLPRLDSLGL